MIGLTIAGFDPSGGAGILTDIKTLHSFNIHPTSIITTLTAQNPKKVYSIKPLDIDFINEQFESIFKEYTINYAKTGLLYSKNIVKLITEKTIEHNLKLVVDPVLVASSGDSLSKDKLIKYLKKYLIPISYITTPNKYEAEKLSGIKIKTKEDTIKAAEKIGENTNVLITGGHLNGCNTLFDGKIKHFNQKLLDTENLHGSGCTLSAAILANLIKYDKKYNLEKIIQESLDFTYNAIKNGRYKTLNP